MSFATKHLKALVNFNTILLLYTHQISRLLAHKANFFVLTVRNILGETFTLSTEVLAQDANFHLKYHYKKTAAFTLKSLSSIFLIFDDH